MATPPPGKSKTSCSITLPSSPSNLIGELALARHDEVGGAILVAEGVAADHDRMGPAGHQPRHVLQTIGSRKMVPPMMLRIVPLGDRHISLRLNSFTRPSSGVMVAHFTATPYCCVALAEVDRHLVVGLVAILDAEVVVLQVDVEIGKDQLVLDELPDDAGHLVAVHLDDRILHLDLRHRASCRAPKFDARSASASRPGCPGRFRLTPRQRAASAAFNVALGRIPADVLAWSGR